MPHASEDLTGIHDEICTRLERAGWLRPCSRSDLHTALEHPNNHDRSAKSVELIRKIWHSFQGLGVAPLVRQLLHQENEGHFFDQYRDHVVHTLEVYLLGLDLVLNLPLLRKLVTAQFGDAGFRRAWAVTALGHDPGYVFEVHKRFQVPEIVQQILERPLADFEFLSDGALRELSRDIMARQHDTQSIESMETFGGLDFFDWLAPDLANVSLGAEQNALEQYHRFALLHGFRQYDHGISSALLIFQLHQRLKEQLGSLPADLTRCNITAAERTHLRNVRDSLDKETEAILRAGCLAIALHNVRKDIWSPEELEEADRGGLRLRQFFLSLETSPLAWLLAFCDTLQRWNRPVIKGVAHHEEQFLEPAAVSLDYQDGKAYLAYRDEEEFLWRKGESLFFKLRLDLVNYLKPDEVDAFLSPGRATIKESVDNSATSAIASTLIVSNYNDCGLITSKNAHARAAEAKKAARRHPDHLPVFVLYTGGSVGMVREDKRDPKSPLVTGKTISEILEHLKRLGELSFDMDFFRTERILDSSNMQPSDWVEIANIVHACHKSYQGFVILHGTDTMTFTASALSFLFKHLDKPVILTGAERPISEIGNDAEPNIMRSLLLAAPLSQGSPIVPEVCVFFGNRLMRGNRAKKLKALAFDGFDSPNSEPLGSVEDRVDVNTRVVRDRILTDRHRQQFNVETKLDDRVAILELYPSSETCLSSLEHLLKQEGTRGLILKTYGTGNAPTAPEKFLQVIEDAVRNDKIIVNLTHCPQGQVEVRLFETNARLFELGVINGGDMTVEAAYTKLMWLLGRYGRHDIAAVKRDIQINHRGELRFSTYNLVYPNVFIPIDGVYPGKSTDVGSFDPTEINHAYVRIHGIGLKARPSDFGLKVYYNCPNSDMPGPSERDRFIGEIRRHWDGKTLLTCNMDATDVVKRNTSRGELISLQIVADASYDISIATVQLSIFTENIKGE